MVHILYNFYLTQQKVNNKNRIFQSLFWLNYRYLKKALKRYYENLSLERLKVDSKSEIIVSLTSFPERISIIHLTIKSILFQTYKPKKVILWLAKEQFPRLEKDLPLKLLKLKKSGLEIEFCEDLKPHKKYFYSFKKHPNNNIVTIDDDVFYPKKTLEILIQNSKKFPKSIIANRVREIEFDNEVLIPYRQWKINDVTYNNPSKYFFPTGVGGVLYRADFFDEQLFNIETIKNKCINADDIWLKANSLHNNIYVVFTKAFNYPFIEIPASQKVSLYSSNVFSKDNDQQIKEVFNFFNITKKSFK